MRYLSDDLRSLAFGRIKRRFSRRFETLPRVVAVTALSSPSRSRAAARTTSWWSPRRAARTATSACRSWSPRGRQPVLGSRGRTDGRDERDQFVESVALLAADPHEFARSLDDDAVRLCRRHGHAATAREIQEPFVAERSQRSQDGVPVHAEDRCEIARRRQSVPGAGFALGDRATDLSCDLLVQLDGLVPTQLDVEDGASDNSSIDLLDRTPPSHGDTSSAEFASAAEALFEEARRRTRRRRRRLIGAALALTAIALGVVFALVVQREPSPAGRMEPRQLVVKPKKLLLRPPYLGVSCGEPNSIACDRVGLAVWVPGSARAVVATISGRRFELTTDPAFVGPHRPGEPRMFVGFLHHAGLRHGPLAVRVENGRNRWTGVRPVHARLGLVVTFDDGARQATSVRVGLAPGWG